MNLPDILPVARAQALPITPIQFSAGQEQRPTIEPSGCCLRGPLGVCLIESPLCP